MTCQDCIYISSKQVGKADNFPLYKCNKTSFLVKGIATPCKYFMYNDGSYYDGHWHCHRCGKSIKVAGLCKKCDKWLSEQGGYLNAIDDSWESISK